MRGDGILIIIIIIISVNVSRITMMMMMMMMMMTVAHAGFDVRNSVAIAFCAVWFIVDNVLVLGIYRVS